VASAEERDPRVNPKAGDWIAGTGPTGIGQEIRVDGLRDGDVYMCRFAAHPPLVGSKEAVPPLPVGFAVPFRMPLATYREQAARGRVLWRAEQGARPRDGVPHGPA
jgi:hypothetical protein